MKLTNIFDGTKTLNGFIRKRCGKYLGSGCFRDVYELKDFPRLVAKVETVDRTRTFANVTEWRCFIQNKDWSPICKWLAPCYGISNDGAILIQRKVRQNDFDKYPTSIPNLFADTKYENFGWIGNRFVCCDYNFFYHVSFRMKKAKWKGSKAINNQT